MRGAYSTNSKWLNCKKCNKCMKPLYGDTVRTETPGRRCKKCKVQENDVQKKHEAPILQKAQKMHKPQKPQKLQKARQTTITRKRQQRHEPREPQKKRDSQLRNNRNTVSLGLVSPLLVSP